MQGLDDFAAPSGALYRAKYGITGDRPLGSDAEPADRAHEHDFGRGQGSIGRGGHSIGL